MATWSHHWLIMRECESYSNLKTTWTLFPWPDEDHIIPRTCSLDLAYLSQGVLKSPLGACSTPFTSLKAQYLRNPSNPHSLTIYILVPYAKTHPVTPAGESLGPCPTPLFNKNSNISETIQIPTPKPYIFFFLMLGHIQWHWQGPPWGHDAPFSLYLRLYISETIQTPTRKPYIFVFHMLVIPARVPLGPCHNLFTL